jgi:DNA-binding MarR family transcriptional regulator
MTNLDLIKYDYLTTGMSLSELAKKYDMTKSSMNRLVKKYEWDLERKQLGINVERKAKVMSAKSETQRNDRNDKSETTETAIEEFISGEARRRAAIYTATEKLLELVYKMLENAEAMAPRDLQAMSSTLINSKQLLDIKPDDAVENKGVVVKMEGPLDKWAG